MELLKDLVDPRIATAPANSDLVRLATEILQTDLSHQRPRFVALTQTLKGVLDSGDEQEIRNAINLPGLPDAKRLLIEALDMAVSSPDANCSLQGLFFAVPVLIVTGGVSNIEISGVLPTKLDVRKLLEDAGAMAHNQNVSLSNALTSLNEIEKVSWAYLRQCNNGDSLDQVSLSDFPPANISSSSLQEIVHLRFLVGLSIGSPKVPKFTETAGDISKWGINFTKQFGEHVKSSSGKVLGIPRRPVSFPRAIFDGLWVANEMSLQVFVSSVLRSSRQKIGEPNVSVATYSDHSVRLRVTSVFDDQLDQTFGWHLSGIDEFSRVVETIRDLLVECGLRNIKVIPAILDP